MNYLEAVLLGVVEGVAEFLPISSTGHLILVSHWLGIPDDEFLRSFEIFIQLGAVMAVVFLYWRSFLSTAVITRLACSFIPTAIVGLTLYPVVKGFLLGSPLVVVGALAAGGVFLIVFERFHTESAREDEGLTDITYGQALIIGLCQSVAVVPGVSRSAATIIGGLFLGLKRVTIVEYSFLLAVPTIAAATVFDIIKSPEVFSAETLPLFLTGLLTSFLVALIVITQLLKFIKNHTFVAFGWYRIFLAALFYFFIL
jgi:undecaprenyl-diphosphatase